MGVMNAGLNHARSMVDQAGARYFANKKAYNDYLWENSFDENGNPIREVSGWELDNGDAIALPYDKNHLTPEGGAISYNDGLPLFGKPGKLAVGFKGQEYAIDTHTHTHPLSHRGFYGGGDIKMVNFVNKGIHILWNRELYWFKSKSNYINYGSWR